MDFARPVFVVVLAEGVNEREEWLRLRDPSGGWSVCSDGVDIGHFENVIFVRPAHKDHKLRHVFHIQRICVAGGDRITAHAKKLSVQRAASFMRQPHFERVRLPGIQRSESVTQCFVHRHPDYPHGKTRSPHCRRVLHLQPTGSISQQIPMSAGGRQRHAGPGFAVPRLDARGGAGAGIRQRDVRVAAVDRSGIEVLVKGEECTARPPSTASAQASIHIRRQTCGSLKPRSAGARNGRRLVFVFQIQF